jgi:ADP-ribosylglycohydrolase
MSVERRDRDAFLGCLLGGAVGDALGAAIEFDRLDAIRARFGPAGLSDLAPAYGLVGAITDDTQLTLFTAEALLRWHNGALAGDQRTPLEHGREAYLRWLHTQGVLWRAEMGKPGRLVKERRLHARRAPGNTCLAALQAGGRGTTTQPANDSKGCGGVMRIAPVGLVAPGLLDPFETGCALAAITHGHPTGYLAAGHLAQLVAELAGGAELAPAIARASKRLEGSLGHPETLVAVENAVLAAGSSARRPAAEEIERLGEGWTAEEALAIGLYCALRAASFEEGVLMAVNHGGDSDSTGSIAGNLLGLLHGARAIPAPWLARLELRELVEEIAADLWRHFGDGERLAAPVDADRFPG